MNAYRRLTLAMVALPALLTVVAVILALRNGVSPFALWIFAAFYLASAIGVEIGFHRYFSHRAFKCGPGLRWVLGIFGSTAGQGPVLFWAATHRHHHRFSDTERDPHAPLSRGVDGFWHAHVGWLFDPPSPDLAKAVPDLMQDRTTLQVSRLYFVWFLLGLALPAGIGLAMRGWGGALEGFLWGGPVRIFANHNVTWSINSLCHVIGSRPHATKDNSRNVWFLAFPSLGGSWHNNHHAYPTAAANDFHWWQLDPSAWILRAAEAVGLIWDVRRPFRRAVAREEST